MIMRWSKRLRQRPLSLATRVMAFVAIAIGLSLLLIGHLVQNAVERHFAEQDADELKVITTSVEQALRVGAVDSSRLTETLSHAVSGHHGVYFQVWDIKGQLIFGPRNTELSQPINNYPPVALIQATNLYRWQADGKTYRGSITQPLIGGEKFSIVAAIDMNFHIHFLDNFRNSLWLIMTLAGAFTMLAAWYGVHQGHAPLRSLSDIMSDVQADRLHVRLDSDDMPGELKVVVNSFNHMIGRLDDSFTRLSHFSADIAHELRTPITNLITQTQVALGKSRSLDEYRELLYSNLEEQERLAKMVNDMLWLAQSEHGLLKPVWEPLNLEQEVRELFDFFEALAEEKRIELAFQGTALHIRGDRSMLRRAISNLLSNALRYTPAGKTIKVTVERENEAYVRLRVENPGPMISSEHLAKIFDRFYQVDPSRQRLSGGAGLGLAIARSIVEAHDGHIDAYSDHDVTHFTISLPIPLNGGAAKGSLYD
jgi:two-component system heavy metal sensor histidine kinase CusS